MSDRPTITAQAHPAPHREQTGLAAVFFGLGAGPVLWSIHLVANYALASHACYSGAMPHVGPPPGAGRIWITLVVIDVIAALVTAIAGLVSWRLWRATRHETSGQAQSASHHADELFEIGEGRTHFLALWGMLTSFAFLLTIMFDLIGLFVVPLCG
jgi:hypothetical protein